MKKHLHSTIFILKRGYTEQSDETAYNLHSTIFILKRLREDGRQYIR